MRLSFSAAALLLVPLASACGSDRSSEPADARRVGAVPVSQANHRGRVRAEGKAFADDGGPFLALGASLFWALWGEAHDAERLDRNLSWLADRDFDYVRILGMVGSETWQDRRIDPRAPDYWAVVDGFMDRLARHGLRAEVTVFADAEIMMPDEGERAEFAEAWARYADSRADQVLFIETANEYAQNGFEAAEVRDLAGRMNALTDVLVAASTPRAPWPVDAADRDAMLAWRTLYGGPQADVVTYHFNRAPGPDGAWRQVALPWRLQFTGVDLPLVWANNEPIGPQSSVVSDDDPVRLAMGAAVTWVSGLAAYTLHTGAGVRGGGRADLDRGRVANLWETPRIDEIAGMLAAVRRALPADLPNWERVGPGDRQHPCRSAGDGTFAARRGSAFVLVIVRPDQPVDCDLGPSASLEIFRAPFAGPPVESTDVDGLQVAIVRTH